MPDSVGLHPDDGRHHRRRRADVARRADGHVKHAVRSEGNELPRVAGLWVREVVTDRHRSRRYVEVALDVVEPEDRPRSPVQRTVPHRDTIGRSRPFAINTTRSALWSPLESTTACSLPAVREPTNTVPFGPSAISRAFSTFPAKTKLAIPPERLTVRPGKGSDGQTWSGPLRAHRSHDGGARRNGMVSSRTSRSSRMLLQLARDRSLRLDLVVLCLLLSDNCVSRGFGRRLGQSTSRGGLYDRV